MKPTPEKYFENPAFREYIFLLVEVERLIREGRNDDPEAEPLHDEMDGPGDKLDAEEVKAVKAFASDLTRMSQRFGSLLLPTEKAKAPSPDTTNDTPPTPSDQMARSHAHGQEATRELTP